MGGVAKHAGLRLIVLIFFDRNVSKWLSLNRKRLEEQIHQKLLCAWVLRDAHQLFSNALPSFLMSIPWTLDELYDQILFFSDRLGSLATTPNHLDDRILNFTYPMLIQYGYRTDKH